MLWGSRLLVGASFGFALLGCSGVDQADEGEGWRLLKSELPADPIPITGGDLLVALDSIEYENLWAGGHMSETRPEVDFGSEVVVRADRFSNDDCDEVVFEGLEEVVGHKAVALSFQPPSGNYCESFGYTHVVFIAVEKAALPKPPFELLLGEGHGGLSVTIDEL